MVVQAVQDIKTQRQSCQALAEKAVQMVLMLADELTRGNFNPDMQKRIATFSGELTKIHASILPYTQYPWFRYVWEKTSISDVINDGLARLDECTRHFQLFLMDLVRLSRFRHPNVPDLIGRSVEEAKAPFAVFSEINPISLRDMFLHYKQADPIEGFMFALSVMQGVASAIHHLSGDLNIGPKDLEACMKIRNLAFSGSGKVVVGYGLILSGPSTSYNLDLSRWLIHHFWYLTHEILYGAAEPIDDRNWDSIQSTLDKHIQPLPTLVGYDSPDFPFIARRLSGILNQLEALKRFSGQRLTYPDIRRELLRAPLAHLCFVYRPQIAIDVALGDIGYMNGGSFVRLTNIREDVAFVTVLNGNPDYVRSAPPLIQSERLKDGTFKHTFSNPIHSNIVRQGDAEHIEDIPTVWQHFLRRAPGIASRVEGLQAEDLILVANIQNGWRGTRLQCKPEEHLDPTKPFTADFVEPLELPEGREWGTWVVAGVEMKDPLCELEHKWTMTPTGHCIKIRTTRYVQRIEFMQSCRSDYVTVPVDSA
ncbi:hypothetical protein FRB98_000913 [Tulasnella sp. 332]|nr:hypothetical protein FRB98_000913 [Tulasnella sp. 332]